MKGLALRISYFSSKKSINFKNYWSKLNALKVASKPQRLRGRYTAWAITILLLLNVIVANKMFLPAITHSFCIVNQYPISIRNHLNLHSLTSFQGDSQNQLLNGIP